MESRKIGSRTGETCFILSSDGRGGGGVNLRFSKIIFTGLSAGMVYGHAKKKFQKMYFSVVFTNLNRWIDSPPPP